MFNEYLLEINAKDRCHFITDIYQCQIFESCQYLKGTLLLNSLADNVILIPTLKEFKTRIKRIVSPFTDLLT